MHDLRHDHTPNDATIDLFLGNLREADRKELRYGCGPLTTRGLIDMVRLSGGTATYYKGQPATLWGVTRYEEKRVAHPWMVGTDVITGLAAGRCLLKHARMVFKAHASGGFVLTNMVYAKNTAHIRFLEALGCQFGPTVPWGPSTKPFKEFTYVRTR